MSTVAELKERLKNETNKRVRKNIREMIDRAESTFLTVEDLKSNREYIINAIKFHLFYKNAEMLKSAMQELVDDIEASKLYYKGNLKNYLNFIAFKKAHSVCWDYACELDGGCFVNGKNRRAVESHYVISQIH